MRYWNLDVQISLKLSISLLAPIIDYAISQVAQYSSAIFFKGLYLHLHSKVCLNLSIQLIRRIFA